MYALRFIHLIRDADGVEIELRKEANCNEPSCGSSDGTNEVEIELDGDDETDDIDVFVFVVVLRLVVVLLAIIMRLMPLH